MLEILGEIKTAKLSKQSHEFVLKKTSALVTICTGKWTAAEIQSPWKIFKKGEITRQLFKQTLESYLCVADDKLCHWRIYDSDANNPSKQKVTFKCCLAFYWNPHNLHAFNFYWSFSFICHIFKTKTHAKKKKKTLNGIIGWFGLRGTLKIIHF